MPKTTNPIENLFEDVKKIIDFIAVKNSREAEKYETVAIAKEADMWMNAMLNKDSYLTYHAFYTPAMFQEVNPTVQFNMISAWLGNIYNVPLMYRDHLLKRGREIILNSYVERNEYYRMLAGLPPLSDGAQEYVYLSEYLRSLYGVVGNPPVHELSELIQNKYMLTDEFTKVLEKYPNKTYLRYMGLYAIDPFVARNAKDFQLIRYTPIDRSDINPYMTKEFSKLYNEYRDYVIFNLYNKELENTYVGYRPYMGFLIVFMVLMQISNSAIEYSSSRRFFDDTIIASIFQMYGIPRTLIFTQEVKRKLVTSLNKMIQKKATNGVFYDLVDILGYDGVTISKLMIMKQQEFDSAGAAVFGDGSHIATPEDMDLLTSIDPATGRPLKTAGSEIYFQALDLKSTDPYTDIIHSNQQYDYSDITDPDPRWWELDDVKALIQDKHYTVADSKYIMLESMIDQTQYLYESVYFIRMILDNKDYTETFLVTVPELFGNDAIPLFDLMVFLIAAMAKENGLIGEIITTASGLLAIAGFNFDIDMGAFKEFLDTTKYTDTDILMDFLSNLSMRNSSDINRLFNDMMIPLRDWLTMQISQTDNREQFVEYEKIYRAIFTYDAVRSVFVDSFVPVPDRIRAKYELSDNDWTAFSLFYPHTISGNTIRVEDMSAYPEYFPFLGDNTSERKTWYITLPSTEQVYFYDIINREDLRYMIDENGDLIKDPVWWNGDEINHTNVDWAISSIRALSDNELSNAFFKTLTYVPNSSQIYQANELLPLGIRNEVFKDILISKIQMDTSGEAQPATTYEEFIQRTNPKLYELFAKYEYAHDDWLSDINNIVVAIENFLDMRLKYFEMAAVGTEMYFKPLVTLIRYFKSYMIDFSRTSIKYIFADKIDAGGNSNMLKMFDDISVLTFYLLIAGRGEKAEFGLYDGIHSSLYHSILHDRSAILQDQSSVDLDKIVNPRKTYMGSLRMVDEVKFFLNGKDIDPDGQHSYWHIGEEGVGRYINPTNHTDSGYNSPARIQNARVDRTGWKEFVESANPMENP